MTEEANYQEPIDPEPIEPESMQSVPDPFAESESEPVPFDAEVVEPQDPKSSNSNKTLIIVLIVIAVLFLCCCCALIVLGAVFWEEIAYEMGMSLAPLMSLR